VSVFLGLMLTFGSSGLVNQIMSGFMVTYSRALRLGDYVRIGDVEGTVIHLGTLSTKLKTYRGEETTIPNAVVVSQTTTDYSRFAENNETFTPTTVTIGYDAPWRQVHALLLQAAERTSGLRREPKPYVRLPRTPGSTLLHAQRPARAHPGSVQRVRRADHVAELSGRSGVAESGGEERLVRRAGTA
jgi:small-conductance mechanosensitive channel